MVATPAISVVTRPGGRFYRVEGYDELFPSVTTVLSVIAKPALVPWARNVALESVKEALLERTQEGPVELTPEWVDGLLQDARRRPDLVKNKAADYGAQAHDLIRQIIQGLTPEVPPEMSALVTNFEAWQKEAGLELHLSETIVYSPRYRYAGSVDATAHRQGALVAIDWKTGSGIYPEYALQVAAYAHALEEMNGEKVSEAWVVRFGRQSAEFEARKLIDLEGAFNAFRAALFLWRSNQITLI